MAEDNSSTDEVVREGRSAKEPRPESTAGYFADGAAAKQIVEGVLNFVQERPWVAVAGAFVLGYVAAQFIKRLD